MPAKSISSAVLAVICTCLFFAPVAGGVDILPLGLSQAPSQPQAVVPACAPITTDTTWTTGNVYVVRDCMVVVPEGVTLTLQPGVTVKFGGTAPGSGSSLGSAGLMIYGTLHAQGTQAQPVIFTSLADDAHGGDTGEDGTSSGAAGEWYGIRFYADSLGDLDHFWLGYGGSGVFASGHGYSQAQIEVINAQVRLTNGTVTGGLRKGIVLDGTGLEPVLANLHIADNNDPAWNSPGYAIYQSTINMQPTYNNLTFSGNDRDEVVIGRFNEAMTQDVVLGGANYGFTCGYSLCLLTVPNTSTLTIQPGTSLDFRPSFGIAVADGGSLIAQGTATKPITFTSHLAEAAEGASGHWMGLWAQQGSSLRLDQCDISYASDTNYGKGGLEINTDDAVVSNCRIHHNAGDGVYLYSRNASTLHTMLENVDVTDNGQSGVFLEASNAGSLSVTWEGGSISRNGWSGVADYTSNSAINPTLRDVTIAGNGSAGDNDDRRRGISFDNHNVNPLLTDVTLTGNVGAAIFWYCNGSIAARDLTATGNGANELTLPGCDVSGGRQWDLGDAAIPTRVTGHINVTPNALLSVSRGTTLHFDKNQYNSPTRLEVQDQASLYALGTVEKPISFTAANATPGWWEGIYAKQRATLALRHCKIGYGGGNSTGSLLIRWGWPNTGVPVADIQNCEIHDSSRKGVHFDFNNYSPVATLPIFRYNHLHDNAEEAVANWNAPVLDARHNYWGDATGPHHAAQNPTGLGDDVGDNITFYPWLGAPETGQTAPGAMLISTGAPSLVSPGESVDYAIQYVNSMTETVRDAVLLLQLPKDSTFVEGSGGTIYWPQRNQVFWLLGDIDPGDQGFVTSRVRYAWGLPRTYRDGSLTLLSGSNFNPTALERTTYTDYAAVDAGAAARISQAEFDALRGTNPDLESLYQEAVGQGYSFVDAARSSFADGKHVASALLSTANRQFSRMISLYDGQALATTVGGDSFTLHDTSGGMGFDPVTLESTYWGDWGPGTAVQREEEAANACTPAKCKVHCVGKSVTFTVVKAAAQSVVSWATFGLVPPPGAFDSSVEVTKSILECKKACDENPLNGCCDAEGDVRWSPGILSGWCTKEYCNATTGTYGTPGQLYCATGTRCVSGTGGQGGCLPCNEGAARYDFKEVRAGDGASACALSGGDGGDCADLGVRVAKDPNAIIGPAGDLLPGATVSYTVTYENEGEGRAYGVYVVNELPNAFDPASLHLHGVGVYLPASREMVWYIGELGPKGAVDAEGFITYTVTLTGGLASGTVIPNQAVVYFSSVPEKTPTNTWVNLVSPLVATPQNLTTDYMTPLPITLHGEEVSSLPLTYALTEQPHGGTLTGTPPNLTYTPAENFTGPDSFSFTVDNGTATSRAAQVRIQVTPAGDATPPTVLWSSPQADATGVLAPATPVFTDTVGPLYSPTILMGMSEALEPSTVTTDTVTLAGSGGPVSALVSFDAGTNQIVLRPRAALDDGQYTVAVSAAVTDVAGNALADLYIFTFRVGAAAELRIYLPAVQR